MELIGSLFLILAVAVLVILFVARPFLQGKAKLLSGASLTAEQEREHVRSSLLAERDRVLNSLQELDFDFALGKVPAEDYPLQRAALMKTGADVLRRLDEMPANGNKAASPLAAPSAGITAEDRIEEAVAARRADASSRGRNGANAVRDSANAVKEARPVQTVQSGNGNGGPNKREDELEDIIARRKRDRKESSAGFCPHCGKPVQKSDKFCSKCGATL